MTTDPIDALLRADEEELKAKRARLRAFSRCVESAREALSAAQDSAKAIASSDGLSRADIARTFELTPAERAVLLPTRRRRPSGGDGAVSDEAHEADDADARPDHALNNETAQRDDGSHDEEEQAHDE